MLKSESGMFCKWETFSFFYQGTLSQCDKKKRDDNNEFHLIIDLNVQKISSNTASRAGHPEGGEVPGARDICVSPVPPLAWPCQGKSCL